MIDLGEEKGIGFKVIRLSFTSVCLSVSRGSGGRTELIVCVVVVDDYIFGSSALSRTKKFHT